jgi:hypothetical protein
MSSIVGDTVQDTAISNAPPASIRRTVRLIVKLLLPGGCSPASPGNTDCPGTMASPGTMDCPETMASPGDTVTHCPCASWPTSFGSGIAPCEPGGGLRVADSRGAWGPIPGKRAGEAGDRRRPENRAGSPPGAAFLHRTAVFSCPLPGRDPASFLEARTRVAEPRGLVRTPGVGSRITRSSGVRRDAEMRSAGRHPDPRRGWT